MSVQKIKDSEIDERLIANLPTRPNAPTALGGKGYSAADLKAAFDSLPTLIAARYNELIDDLTNEDGSEAIRGAYTGVEGETVGMLLDGMKDGTILDKILIDEEILSAYLRTLKAEIAELRDIIGGRTGV